MKNADTLAEFREMLVISIVRSTEMTDFEIYEDYGVPLERIRELREEHSNTSLGYDLSKVIELKRKLNCPLVDIPKELIEECAVKESIE